MLSVQSSLLCPQLLNRKHHMGMSMLPCISYCNLSINNIHSGEWETCSKGRSLAALCESSYRQEAIGRLIYRDTIFCTLKTCKQYFRARQYYELSLVGRSKLQMPVSIDYLPFFSWQSQHPYIATPCFNVNLHDVLFASLFSSS